MTATAPRRREAVYKPRGAALALFAETAPEALLSGPAGTGKSVACLNRVYHAAVTYPGMRALVVRQVRASLTETGLVSWEKQVLPPGSPVLAGPSRGSRVQYQFPNGSRVNVGGLDRPDKIMSSEYDLIYVQEATELKEDGWEALTTRLRNGVMPVQQLIADCNPAGPGHWLKRRCDAGRCRLLESRHEDNPRLWAGGRWTEFGVTYLARLDALTGARRLRLRFGRWVQAEGVVYDGYDAAVHVVDPFPVPAAWPRLWVVDFGYTNPFVWHEYATDPDGRAYLVREVYRTQRLVEDHCREIAALTADSPRPTAVVCDHDAEDRATLERHLGVRTTAARKGVAAGIQAVAARLKVQPDGKPRLALFRGCRVGAADPTLDEARRPTCTADEWDSYVWDDAKTKEQPVKENDHGMDCVRYACAHWDRAKPDIAVGRR